ncbi:MAG TPA: AsmA-like C-terminal region-containing protein [Vicinamibacterales bacterium]|jgi:uncharacterized protein involved in outer membrane biogenesis
MKRLLIILGSIVVLGAILLAIAVRVVLGGDRIKSAIESQAAIALGQPVTIRTAVPHFFPRIRLDLTGVSIGASREVEIERVRLATGIRALLGRRVDEADVAIEQSRIDVGWALALLAALDADTPAAAPPSSYPLAIDAIGSIALRDVTLVAGKHTLLVNMSASFSGGDRLEIQTMRAESETSRFTASGALASVSKRTGTFTVDADALDLDGLMAFLAAATPASQPATGETQPPAPGDRAKPPPPSAPLAIDVAIRSREGRALGVALSDLSATARVRESDALLDDLKVAAFGGRYTGSAAFRGAQKVGRYEWKGSFENLDVPRLMEFAGAAGSMTGRLSGTIALAAAGFDPAEAIRGARGSSRVVVTDGRIPGLEIVRSVILAFGKPTGDRPAGSGEAFTRIAATLAIDGPDIATKDLDFESRDFDMTGEGRFSLASQAIRFRTDVVLSRELSAQAGRDLYRLAREGERIVLPATIDGTIGSPTVFIDVQAALGRALRNKAQDELKGLFDRFRKRIGR